MSYLAKNYSRKKISFKYGKGSYLYSTSNKKYLDINICKLHKEVLFMLILSQFYTNKKAILYLASFLVD